jgi:hypothetical protein
MVLGRSVGAYVLVRDSRGRHHAARVPLHERFHVNLALVHDGAAGTMDAVLRTISDAGCPTLLMTAGQARRPRSDSAAVGSVLDPCPIRDPAAGMTTWLLEDNGEEVSTVMSCRVGDALTIWCTATRTDSPDGGTPVHCSPTSCPAQTSATDTHGRPGIEGPEQRTFLDAGRGPGCLAIRLPTRAPMPVWWPGRCGVHESTGIAVRQ